MPRKPRPRALEAGEVVSFFEEMPVEHAALILGIVTARVAKRQAQATRSVEEPGAPPTPVSKRTRKAVAKAVDDAAADTLVLSR